MNPTQLITHLNRIGAKLVVEGEKLICDAPKNTMAPDLLENIRENKAALMALLDKGIAKNIAGRDEPEIKTVEREKVHPLSYAQKRMIVLHSMQADESVFNIALAFNLKGQMDIPALDTAVNEIVGCHELLRTSFSWVNDEPVQRIENDLKVQVSKIDLHPFTGIDHENLYRKMIDQESKKPFDLSRAPLFRAVLFENNNDCILLLVSHYLIADEASMTIIAREIQNHYNGKPSDGSTTQKPSFQYVDYVSWEAAFLNSAAAERQLQFWSKRLHQFRLEDFDGEIKPFTRRARFYEAECAEFIIPDDITSALETFSQHHQASLFMACYAIFTVIIASIYDIYRFCCGTPIVNRSRIELEGMMGYFANTLILRSELSGELPFEEYLGTARTEVLQVFSNGDLPLEYVLEKTGAAVDQLTRLMFTYAEDDHEIFRFGQSTAHRLRINENGVQNVVAELSLYIRRSGNRLIGSLLCAKNRFEPVVVKYLINDFRRVAKDIVKEPRITIGELIARCESTIHRRNSADESSAAHNFPDRQTSQAGYKAPRDDIEKLLVGIWSDILGDKKIGITDDFFSLGGTSFQAVKLFSALQRQFDVKLPISSLLHAPTIESLANTIRHKGNGRQWSPIVPIQPNGNRPPLYFVHGAGGNVLLYRDLSRFLGQQQPFYGIQAKGLDGRAELLTTVEVMADYYVKEIVKMQPDGPYYLGGYCLGGQIAYEMARNLLKMGKRVAFVALLDTQRRWNAEEGFKLKLLHRYQQIAFHLRNFLLADYKGKAAFVRDKMIELSRRIKRRLLVFMSITAFELKLRSERPLVVMEHVNDRAANNYVALPYDGTITLFCPKGNYAGYEDPLMGWGDGLTRGVDVHRLSVYPAGMLIDPFVGELAEIMRNCLEEAQQKKDKTQRRYSRNMH